MTESAKFPDIFVQRAILGFLGPHYVPSGVANRMMATNVAEWGIKGVYLCVIVFLILRDQWNTVEAINR